MIHLSGHPSSSYFIMLALAKKALQQGKQTESLNNGDVQAETVGYNIPDGLLVHTRMQAEELKYQLEDLLRQIEEVRANIPGEPLIALTVVCAVECVFSNCPELA